MHVQSSLSAGEQSLWLPWPPSVNNLFSQGIVKGKVRRFPSPQYKKWRKAVGKELMAARLESYTEPVVLLLELTPRDARPRDADNYNKAIIDALVEATVLPGDDSRWVKSVTASWKNPDAKQSGVRITIQPARMELHKPAMMSAEQKTFARISRVSTYLVPASYKPSAAIKALVAKGYIEELPGLIPDAPQGFRVKP